MALYMTQEEYQRYKLRFGNAVKPVEAVKRPEPEGQQKRSKYGNRRVEVDGFKFDSQHEAEVYLNLRLQQRAGQVRCICRQVRFDLPGKISYFADFVVWMPDGTVQVLDAKSSATAQNRVYINKKKQMREIYGIEILEV